MEPHLGAPHEWCPGPFHRNSGVLPIFGQNFIIPYGKTIYTILTCKYDTKIPGEHSSKFFEWFWSLLMRRNPAEPHHFFIFATVKDPKKGASLPSILEKQLQKPLTEITGMSLFSTCYPQKTSICNYICTYIYNYICLCT